MEPTRLTKAARIGIAAIFAVVLVSFASGPAKTAPSPYTSIEMAPNDGGCVLCRPSQFDPTPITSGNASQRGVLVQVDENATAAVRVGNKAVRGSTSRKNGIQLKARESVPLTVGAGNPAYCVVENSDASVWVCPVFGVGGPL